MAPSLTSAWSLETTKIFFIKSKGVFLRRPEVALPYSARKLVDTHKWEFLIPDLNGYFDGLNGRRVDRSLPGSWLHSISIEYKTTVNEKKVRQIMVLLG